MYIYRVLLSLLLCGLNLFAEDDNLYLESFLKETMSYKKIIHTNYTNTAILIDNYISNDYENEHSSSMHDRNYIFIKSSIIKAEGEKYKFDNKIRFKLYLPKLRKKYKLVFESEDEIKDKDVINKKTEDIDYDLAIDKNKTFKNDILFKQKLGISLRSKLNPFYKVSLEKKGLIYDSKYLLKQELKSSIVNKFEFNSLAQLSYKIDESKTFTNTNRYYWISKYKEENNIFNLLSIKNSYSKKNSLSYNISFNSNNKDSNFKLKRYSFYLDFQHKIREWLYLNITPENYFEDKNSFKPKYLIGFSFSMKITKK